jgi:hypothetical protein
VLGAAIVGVAMVMAFRCRSCRPGERRFMPDDEEVQQRLVRLEQRVAELEAPPRGQHHPGLRPSRLTRPDVPPPKTAPVPLRAARRRGWDSADCWRSACSHCCSRPDTSQASFDRGWVSPLCVAFPARWPVRGSVFSVAIAAPVSHLRRGAGRLRRRYLLPRGVGGSSLYGFMPPPSGSRRTKGSPAFPPSFRARGS